MLITLYLIFCTSGSTIETGAHQLVRMAEPWASEILLSLPPPPTTPHWSYRHALWYPTSYTGSGDLNSGTRTSRPSHLPNQSLCFLDQHLPQGCASKTCPWVSVRCTVIGNCPEAYNLAVLTGSAMDATPCLMSLKSSLLRTPGGALLSPHKETDWFFSSTCIESHQQWSWVLITHPPFFILIITKDNFQRQEQKSTEKSPCLAHKALGLVPGIT